MKAVGNCRSNEPDFQQINDKDKKSMKGECVDQKTHVEFKKIGKTNCTDLKMHVWVTKP